MSADNRIWGETSGTIQGVEKNIRPHNTGGVIRDLFAVTLMLVGGGCVLVGAWAMWGWAAALFIAGLGCVVVGLVLAVDVQRE